MITSPAYSALTPGKIPKVKTGSTTPSIENSVITESAGNITVAGNISATNLSGTNTGDQTTVSGNAGTATALAANGANCSAGEYPLGVDASGAVESCADATTEISSAISALSSVYQPLEATLADIADGTITEDLVNTANPWADNEVADTITASNYLPLAGGTLTGEVITDDLGLEFTAGDALSSCTSFSATGGGIFYDDSEGKFKKCQDNTLTDLDTGGAETNNLETLTTGIAVNEVPTGTAADTVVYKLLPDCNVAGSALNYEDSTQTWSCRSGLGGGSFDATTVDAVTWSDGANASNIWTFDLSGTDPTITFNSGAVAVGGNLTATNLSGTNTGDQTTVSGNAGTVTFADAGGDTTTFVALGTAATGSLAPATDAGLSYNATTNALTATTFVGALTGNADTVTTNANLTGEVTSSGNATTIADSVTVTGWAMGASTATSPSADDNDTSLATTAYVQTEINAMGGRSLTASSGSMDADVELYTSTKCVYIEDPVAADDLKSLWINDSANGFTLTKLWAESDQTVTCMLQVDDGTPADVDSVDLVAITTPDTDTSLDGDATMAAGDRLDLDVASVSGTPTWVSICWTGVYDD